MNEKFINKIGWIASTMTLIVFLSYFDQIRLNLADKPGSILLPLATIISCTSWCSYALLKQKKEWPIFVCNAFGIIVAFITVITSIF